jgi:lipoprotein-anchoring transpeptidase ErfK/SrfK
MRYSIGVGREGFQWGGSSKIVAKQEWPSWTPPQTMIERDAAGVTSFHLHEGGPGNPLGAAPYIGGTFTAHGTFQSPSAGQFLPAASAVNADVIDYGRQVKTTHLRLSIRTDRRP